MHARADAEVAAGVSVVAGLEVTVATVEAGVARAVVVELVVVAATASRARLVPAPVVCKATSVVVINLAAINGRFMELAGVQVSQLWSMYSRWQVQSEESSLQTP